MRNRQLFQGKFEQFLETYQLKAQIPLDPKKVKVFLEKELELKRDKLIEQAFNQMSVAEILDALEFLEAEYPTEILLEPPCQNENDSHLQPAGGECSPAHKFVDFELNDNHSQLEPAGTPLPDFKGLGAKDIFLDDHTVGGQPVQVTNETTLGGLKITEYKHKKKGRK